MYTYVYNNSAHQTEKKRDLYQNSCDSNLSFLEGQASLMSWFYFLSGCLLQAYLAVARDLLALFPSSSLCKKKQQQKQPY